MKKKTKAANFPKTANRLLKPVANALITSTAKLTSDPAAVGLRGSEVLGSPRQAVISALQDEVEKTTSKKKRTGK
jgi:hypothetical protein